MKAYRISTGHLLPTSSTPPERESAFPDATCSLQAVCLVRHIMALFQACQAPLAEKVERQRHFIISTTEILWFHWLQTLFVPAGTWQPL